MFQGSRWVLACLLLGTGLCAPPAFGALPGQNGKIAYDRYDAETDETTICLVNPGGGSPSCPLGGIAPAWAPSGTKFAFTGGGIWTANADGSGASPVTTGPEEDATWSPSGTRIAFSRFAPNPCVPTCTGEIHAIDTDGTDEVNLTNDPTDDDYAAWSPNGQRIAWQRGSSIWTMKPDGSEKSEVAPGSHPNWSPDGTKLAFDRGGIWVMNADGSGQTKVTSGSDRAPAWSPDGTKIAFHRQDFAAETDGIWTVDSDGSNVTPVVTESGLLAAFDRPDWQPLPANTFTDTFVRPKGATPIRASLVPAAKPCTSPDRTHGPPLAFPSCNPPQPGSTHLTVGVGDGSPAFSRSVGHVRMGVIVGSPGPPDDSDVALRFSLTNVMRAADLSEYTGELRAEVKVRVTDVDSTFGGSPAPRSTTMDFPLAFTVPCTPTPGSSIDASTCEALTSVNAVIPGAIKDTRRSIWALDALRVYDGGPDEDADTATDNSLFAVQGVFVP